MLIQNEKKRARLTEYATDKKQQWNLVTIILLFSDVVLLFLPHAFRKVILMFRRVIFEKCILYKDTDIDTFVLINSSSNVFIYYSVNREYHNSLDLLFRKYFPKSVCYRNSIS